MVEVDGGGGGKERYMMLWTEVIPPVLEETMVGVPSPPPGPHLAEVTGARGAKGGGACS